LLRFLQGKGGSVAATLEKTRMKRTEKKDDVHPVHVASTSRERENATICFTE